MLFSPSFLCTLFSLYLCLSIYSLWVSPSSVSSIQVHLTPLSRDGHPTVLRVCAEDWQWLKSRYPCILPSEYPNTENLVYACWDHGEHTDCECFCYGKDVNPVFDELQQTEGAVAEQSVRDAWYHMMDVAQKASERAVEILGRKANTQSVNIVSSSPITLPLDLPLEDNPFNFEGGVDLHNYDDDDVGVSVLLNSPRKSQQYQGHRREPRESQSRSSITPASLGSPQSDHIDGESLNGDIMVEVDIAEHIM